MQQSRKLLTDRNQREYNFKKDLVDLDVEKIIKLDLVGMRNGLLNNEFTSLDLVNIFAQRCYHIGRALSLTTQENFMTAQSIAVDRDLERRKAQDEGEEAVAKLGQFHGIPIAIDDSIFQKGKRTTMGMACLTTECQDTDSPVLTLLVNQGAIPLVKGNIS